jgi:hypothetical protein
MPTAPFIKASENIEIVNEVNRLDTVKFAV